MYDMYPWDSRADGPRTRPPGPRDAQDADATETQAATRAVQVALDRRDNGGDAAAARPAHPAVRSGQ